VFHHLFQELIVYSHVRWTEAEGYAWVKSLPSDVARLMWLGRVVGQIHFWPAKAHSIYLEEQSAPLCYGDL